MCSAYLLMRDNKLESAVQISLLPPRGLYYNYTFCITRAGKCINVARIIMPHLQMVTSLHTAL